MGKYLWSFIFPSDYSKINFICTTRMESLSTVVTLLNPTATGFLVFPLTIQTTILVKNEVFLYLGSVRSSVRCTFPQMNLWTTKVRFPDFHIQGPIWIIFLWLGNSMEIPNPLLSSLKWLTGPQKSNFLFMDRFD